MMGLCDLASMLIGTVVNTRDAEGGVWMPPQASDMASDVDAVFFFIYWICVFFFVLIVALMTIFVIKYRRREGRTSQPSPTHHTPLELTWTIVPLILVIAIFWVGLKGYADMVQEPKNAYEVYVTAQQWSWLFEHPAGPGAGAQNDRWLRVPAGRPIKLIMTSQDVLHALYIPAFRVKQDVVPGRYTYLWFEANEPGIHQIFCAEYCGTSHSQMGAFLEVLAPAAFETQIKIDADWLDPYPDEALWMAGTRLYSRCQQCHSLDGTPRVAPSFKETHDFFKAGRNRVLADGSEVKVDENYLLSSLTNPGGQIVEPYPNQMPLLANQLGTRGVTAMVEFIKRLDEVELDAKGNPVLMEAPTTTGDETP